MTASFVSPAGATWVSVFSGLSLGECCSSCPAQGNNMTGGQRLQFLWRGWLNHSLQHSNSPGLWVLLKRNYYVLLNFFQFAITHNQFFFKWLKFITEHNNQNKSTSLTSGLGKMTPFSKARGLYSTDKARHSAESQCCIFLQSWSTAVLLAHLALTLLCAEEILHLL